MPYERELAVALEAAALATEYLKIEYAAFVMVPDAPASISTHADRESQEIILKHLHAAFPLDGLVAEEKTPTLAASPVNTSRQWVVDPIDGTRGFALKNGEYSTMIGLTVNGKPVVGVVGEPSLGRMTYAVEGGGCWRKDGDGERARTEGSDPGNAFAPAARGGRESTRHLRGGRGQAFDRDHGPLERV
jgi:3'(2'), 5'-bisphosphate nucleotidase